MLFILELMCISIVSLFANLAYASQKQTLWVYTSIYTQYAEPLKIAFQKNNPDIEVQLYQSGSEKLQSKVEAELAAGRPLADIILTSNPFWAAGLAKRQLLHLPKGRKDFLTTNYYSLMVLVVNKSLPKLAWPTSFKDLQEPKYKKLIQFGSPLESGTAFSSTQYLVDKYGWDFFKNLAKNELSSSGGNSTTLQKVESGQKKIGIALLENALEAKLKHNSQEIEIIYPQDGAIPITNVQIILNTSKAKDAAEKFGEFILSQEGQNLLRNGYMYSILKDMPPPQGAEPLDKVTKNSTPWTMEKIFKTEENSKNIKRQYADLILG